jgi:LmbE family N-acetylglucosaminyl deacetylase
VPGPFSTEFVSGSRLLFIAPHPDDEALAASVILQRAVRAGAAVRVVYATDGDDNPWPQRLREKKWRLDAADRERWGELRREEGLAALRILGVAENEAQFLGLPDQGLTDFLLRGASEIVSRLVGIILKWRPNEVLAPAVFDTHPDHSALGVLVRMALAEAAMECLPPIQQWSYLVHGRSKTFARASSYLSSTEAECARKRSAILCHRTQTRLSRGRFLGYAKRPERFAPVEASRAIIGEGSVRFSYRRRSTLCLSLRRQVAPWFAPAADAILLIGTSREGEARSLVLGMPRRSGLVTLENGSTGEPMGAARFHGDAFRGKLFIPTDLFSTTDSIFVKLQRRSWFFDEAGWFEISGTQVRATTRAKIPGRETLAGSIR